MGLNILFMTDLGALFNLVVFFFFINWIVSKVSTIYTTYLIWETISAKSYINVLILDCH